MAGRVADGGFGQETTDARGRRRIRMAGSNRLRAPGGAIVLAGSRAITRTRKPDLWTRKAARSNPAQARANYESRFGAGTPYEGLSPLQQQSLDRQARRTGVDVREMRRRLDNNEARPTGQLKAAFRNR